MKKIRERSVTVDPGHQSSCLHSEKAHNTPTLFDICVDYVSENLSLVESFIDFPDIIGLKIFRTAASKDMFYCYARLAHVKSLKLFCDAYKEQILSQLDVSETFWLSENLLKALSIFENLKKLDLSSCQIAGCISQFGAMLSRFECLEDLSLHNNGLSDWDLRCLTAASRIAKKSIVSMKKLDLSCNPALTEDCAAFLVYFNSLEYLDLSGTGFQVFGTKILSKKMNMTLSSTNTERIGTFCETTGLASGIVQQWLEQGRPRTRGEILASSSCSDGETGRNTTSFYGFESVESTTCSPKPEYKPVIILRRNHKRCPKVLSHLNQRERKHLSTKAALKEIFDSEIGSKVFSQPSRTSTCDQRDLDQSKRTMTNLDRRSDWKMLQSYLTPAVSAESSSLFSAMASDDW